MIPVVPVCHDFIISRNAGLAKAARGFEPSIKGSIRKNSISSTVQKKLLYNGVIV
jgi:hypothetical protein